MIAPPVELHVVIRVIEVADVAATARMHRAALAGGFFVGLGDRFMRGYHRTFVTSPAGIGLVAERNGQIIGFVTGTVDEATHYRHVVRRDRWALGARGAMALAARPAEFVRFVRTRAFRYARGIVRLSRGPLPAAGGGRKKRGVLSHLVVAEAERGCGVGAVLLCAFEDTARAQGARDLRLVASGDNHRAHAFYERSGWVRGDEDRDVDGGVWMSFVRSVER